MNMQDASRQLTLSPTLPEDHILGLREYAARVDFDGGNAILDHTFGYGGLGLSLTVTFVDGTDVTETVKLNDAVQDWVTQIVNEHAMNMQGADPAGKESSDG